MSLKERFGTEVWEALQKNTRVYADVYVQWASVGEVAKDARVSRATAKKYLEMLVREGYAKSMKFGNRTGYSVSSEKTVAYQE